MWLRDWRAPVSMRVHPRRAGDCSQLAVLKHTGSRFSRLDPESVAAGVEQGFRAVDLARRRLTARAGTLVEQLPVGRTAYPMWVWPGYPPGSLTDVMKSHGQPEHRLRSGAGGLAQVRREHDHGRADVFGQAITRFAAAYADQDERDHKSLLDPRRRGTDHPPNPTCEIPGTVARTGGLSGDVPPAGPDVSQP
jgi:hypothetical protein